MKSFLLLFLFVHLQSVNASATSLRSRCAVFFGSLLTSPVNSRVSPPPALMEETLVVPPNAERFYRLTLKRGGGQADVFFPTGRDVVYRVPRAPGPNLNDFYWRMAAAVGDQMPSYRGTEVVLVEVNGKLVPRRAYVFDIVDPQRFIEPSLEKLEQTPVSIRKRVAASLRELQRKMGEHGHIPADIRPDNYVFDPETGEIMLFPDSGCFMPKGHQYADEQRRDFERQVNRWLLPEIP